MPCDCVDQMARPLAKVMTASVTRKGGMRRRATATPFTRPTATPDREHGEGRRRPRCPATSPPVSRHHPGAGDARERDHGGHREVDAAGEEHQRLAQGDGEEREDVRKHVAEVGARGEAGHERGEGDEVDEAREGDAPVAQRAEGPPHAPPAFLRATCAPHIRGAISAWLPWWITKPGSRIDGRHGLARLQVEERPRWPPSPRSRRPGRRSRRGSPPRASATRSRRRRSRPGSRGRPRPPSR